MTDTNTNCLAGWKCPDCGHTSSFHISVEIRTVVLMTDDGYDDPGDVETVYDDGNWASCCSCGHVATVGYFTGGDDDA